MMKFLDVRLQTRQLFVDVAFIAEQRRLGENACFFNLARKIFTHAFGEFFAVFFRHERRAQGDFIAQCGDGVHAVDKIAFQPFALAFAHGGVLCKRRGKRAFDGADKRFVLFRDLFGPRHVGLAQ